MRSRLPPIINHCVPHYRYRTRHVLGATAAATATSEHWQRFKLSLRVSEHVTTTAPGPVP